MLNVIGNGRTVDKYVIKKRGDKAAKERLKNQIHSGLECRWGIRQPEGHHKKLIMTLMGVNAVLGTSAGLT